MYMYMNISVLSMDYGLVQEPAVTHPNLLELTGDVGMDGSGALIQSGHPPLEPGNNIIIMDH